MKKFIKCVLMLSGVDYLLKISMGAYIYDNYGKKELDKYCISLSDCIENSYNLGKSIVNKFTARKCNSTETEEESE